MDEKLQPFYTDWKTVKEFAASYTPPRRAIPGVTKQYIAVLVARETAKPLSTEIDIKYIDDRHYLVRLNPERSKRLRAAREAKAAKWKRLRENQGKRPVGRPKKEDKP